MTKRLPLGLQDFRGIIEDGYKYIDKTEYIYKMCRTGKYFFLSRPRRFGKSITVSVLKELYAGSRSLFEGLWIENHWDWTKKHPVIKISFTSLGFHEVGLRESLDFYLNGLITENKLAPVEGNITTKFGYLMKELSAQEKVVILIDEYDAPIINYLATDDEKAKANRDTLKSFYSVLKDSDDFLELVFITGVSKFSKVGIFSGMNNLLDLSMDAEFATMLGYTQNELETSFQDEIQTAAQHLASSKDETLAQMKHWYNGYKFHPQAQTVYNPVSINLFLHSKEFKNFWFETGTPTFLVNILKKEGLYDFDLEAQSPEMLEIFDLDELNPYGLMYQTGYLTITRQDEFGFYYLDYPNYEVRRSMLEYLLAAFGGTRRGTGAPLAVKLEFAFKDNNLKKVIEMLQTVFAKLPYFLHEQYPEKFFHAAIHLLFSYIGLRIHSEVCTSDGRVDALVETDTHYYILEFKLDKSAEEAFQQIITKKYYQSYLHQNKTVVGVGVNFDSQTKNITDWVAKSI